MFIFLSQSDDVFFFYFFGWSTANSERERESKHFFVEERQMKDGVSLRLTTNEMVRKRDVSSRRFLRPVVRRLFHRKIIMNGKI